METESLNRSRFSTAYSSTIMPSTGSLVYNFVEIMDWAI